MEHHDSQTETSAPDPKKVVRIAPPFAFTAHVDYQAKPVEVVVAVVLNSKDCRGVEGGGHHCTLSIEAAELAHAKLAETIAAAKAKRAQLREGGAP